MPIDLKQIRDMNHRVNWYISGFDLDDDMFPDMEWIIEKFFKEAIPVLQPEQRRAIEKWIGELMGKRAANYWRAFYDTSDLDKAYEEMEKALAKPLHVPLRFN